MGLITLITHIMDQSSVTWTKVSWSSCIRSRMKRVSLQVPSMVQFYTHTAATTNCSSSSTTTTLSCQWLATRDSSRCPWLPTSSTKGCWLCARLKCLNISSRFHLPLSKNSSRSSSSRLKHVFSSAPSCALRILTANTLFWTNCTVWFLVCRTTRL